MFRHGSPVLVSSRLGQAKNGVEIYAKEMTHISVLETSFRTSKCFKHLIESTRNISNTVLLKYSFISKNTKMYTFDKIPILVSV